MSWQHFTERELACSHCGACEMDEKFMKRLGILRLAFGAPMIVSSGYRCPDHPIEARKDAPGAHATGSAVDIAVSGHAAHRLLKLALEYGFSGIGVQQRGDGRFLHLDTLPNSPGRPRPWVWSYG
jgi:uncharacterized protein YcbK (DUF882 family)